jgi:hypothetical protein
MTIAFSASYARDDAHDDRRRDHRMETAEPPEPAPDSHFVVEALHISDEDVPSAPCNQAEHADQHQRRAERDHA